MCGIHGIVCGSKDILRKMISESSSRGPDGSSFYHDTHIGLGHNLLSMSGVSSVSQPYHSQCGRYVLVFNGEIYNYKDYLDDGAYEDLGDVPVLMQLLSQSHEETEVLSTLSGMYAIAVYDRHNRTIFLARDTHGAKPLYYSIGENGKLIFSSEIDSLRAAGVDVSKPNIDALNIYLGLGYVPGQFTVFSKIQKIVPGGWLRYSIDKRQIVANGLVEKRKELEVASAQDYRHKLSSSVKKTADSRRKIALNLSGGLDSASILYELSVQGACVDTYTTRYVGDSKTESFKNNIDAKFAKELVAAFGTGVHNEIEINSSQYFDAAADAADALEVPDGNKSLPLYWFHTKEVSKGGVSGILSGEGADELLCGYNRYRHLTSSPAGIFSNGVMNLSRIRSQLGWSSLIKILFGKNPTDIFYTGLRRRIGAKKFKRLMLLKQRYSAVDLWVDELWEYPSRNIAWRDNKQVIKTLKEQVCFILGDGNSSTDTLLDALSKTDMLTWLAEEALIRSDKLGGAFGMESRFPFLSDPFFTWARSLETHQKHDGTEMKAISKKAYGGIFQTDFLYRRKSGWSGPVDHWLSEAKQSKSPILNVLSTDYWSGLEGVINFENIRQVNDASLFMKLLNLQFWAKKYGVYV